MSAGPVRRFGEEESRRAPDGGTAKNAGVTWERVDAEDGGLRACPSVDRSATPRLLTSELDFRSPGPDFRSPGPGFRSPGLGLGSPEPGLREPEPGLREPEPGLLLYPGRR
ncbi:hypothetical protein ACTI_27330 [Actinoplanes sp. OR16]|nr:hypothetical protein ACTI_27330 [Actinoplanes sp. OR16]